MNGFIEKKSRAGCYSSLAIHFVIAAVFDL